MTRETEDEYSQFYRGGDDMVQESEGTLTPADI